MRKTIALLAAAMSAAAFAAPSAVTMESLLKEMVDTDANTRFPEPAYTARLWSSYDRRSTGPDKPDWFANADYNKYLGTNVTAKGETELVMLDAKGPGAITRFWITTGGNVWKGNFRLYIDGKAVVDENCIKFVSDGVFCPAPLSDRLPKRHYGPGHNLYLPIPYAKSCRVVYLPKPGKDAEGQLFYNIETRTYAPGTKVESFSKEVLARAKKTIDAVNRRLDRRMAGFDKKVDETVEFNGTIHPNQSITRKIDRPDGGAIRRLAMWFSGEAPDYLRTTVLEMSFDGERTVWVPVGDFFGCGVVYESFNGWFTSCPGANQFDSRWVMPFAKTCTLTIHNYGARAVSIAGSSAEVGPYEWDDRRSMHFGAAWHNYADVESRKGDKREQWDYDYAELEGKGLFVGTTLTLWQSITDWWGEGDEKVFVDGESFPSFIGTGTEDYYGYAWCDPMPYSHPFLCQPVGINTGRSLSPNTARRGVSNIRNRALDAIPFTKSIRFLMEMWHWKDVHIDFAPLAVFYMRPGGKCNHGEDVEAVRKPIRVAAADLVLPPTAKLFAAFDGSTYGDWTVEGDCFGDGPARGALPGQSPVTGFTGKGLVNTFLRGDDTTGKLTSPEFTIEKPYVNFLIGGGHYKGETCVNLVVDGKVERTASGHDNEHLDWASWDVSGLKGRKARIEIVDSRKGHFAHTMVDMIIFDDEPQTP